MTTPEPVADTLPTADRTRLGLLKVLRDARDTKDGRLLAEVVQANLQHLWEHGGHSEQTRPGRRPEWIYVRFPFVGRPAASPAPPLSQLIKSKGLQLRLLLLLLFDAQCRYQPDDAVLNVRRIAGHSDQEYEPWRQLVLTETLPTAGTGRGPADLRARQITEALRALEEQHLLQIPRQMPSGRRRQYDPGKDGTSWHLLSEASTAEEHPRYRIPSSTKFCTSSPTCGCSP